MPHIELDSIFWKPKWIESSADEFRSNVASALEKHADGWVCDGNYSKVIDLILPSADTVIWLHYPLYVAFCRLLKRTIARAIDRQLLWGTNEESFRQAFFSRRSLLLYQVTHWRKFGMLGERVSRVPNKARLLELRSQKELNALLSALENRV